METRDYSRLLLGSTSTETDFACLHELIEGAREKLNGEMFDFVAGGAESETTLRRNRMALDSLALRRRVLRGHGGVDASTEAFGRRMRLPVVLSPIGSLQWLHPEGGAAAAQAAGEFGVAHMLAWSADPGLEGVAAAAPDALRLYQLYVRGTGSFIEDHVKRAIDAGVHGFFITVDVPIISRRERDLVKRFEHPGRRSGPRLAELFKPSMDLHWRDVAAIKSKYNIPLGIKGIVTAEDAELAVEHGVDWIYVSNHGGRQLDHEPAAIEVLEEIVSAVRGRAKIIVDGSICRGTDIVKAIAAGADLVGIGRMHGLALAAAGRPGVVRMLELLEDEVQRTMIQMGARELSELNRSCLRPTMPTNPPHVFSAFPLLRLPEFR